MEGLITIDGSLFEGGGQMIRSSLALSLILQKEFTVHSIRKNRPNPGINNQLRSVYSAFTEKEPKVGDTEVYFYPKFLEPTQIKSSSAASCTLMMQCLVPVCAGLHYEKEIKINGGTDVNRSPPLQSIRLGLMPLLEEMGIRLSIIDVKPGYYPVGRGSVTIGVQCQETIRPIKRVKLGLPEKVVITYYVKAQRVPNGAKQLRKEIQRIINASFAQEIKLQFDIKFQKVFNTKGEEYGIGCLILGENILWDIGTVGEPVREEVLIQRLIHYAQHKCCLDEHHQDQLLLYASLAAGKSQIRVGNQLSLHTQSLLYVIKSFIPELQHTHQDGILTIQGISYRRE